MRWTSAVLFLSVMVLSFSSSVVAKTPNLQKLVSARPKAVPFSSAAEMSPLTKTQQDEQDEDEMALVEVQAQTQRVRSYCEICILVMQLKQRGQPHLCAGLSAAHYITCIENLESLLRADKAVVYWLKNGCMHMDSTGPEIVRPCPALSICSWVPNLFAQPPSLVRDGVESLCPKDPKFLPTIPNEYKTLLQPQNAALPGPGAAPPQ